MKTLVAFVVFLSILMSTMDTAALYVALIQNFGNYVALLTSTYSGSCSLEGTLMR